MPLGARHAEIALKLDRGDAVHSIAAQNYILSSNHEMADYHSKRAMALNSNDPGTIWRRGIVLSYLGDQAGAMKLYEEAMGLDPTERDNESFCDCLFMQGKYEGVLAVIRSWSGMPTHLKLVQAATHALLRQEDQSRSAMEEFSNGAEPRPVPQTMVKFQMRMLARQEDRDRWLEGYRKAGIEI